MDRQERNLLKEGFEKELDNNELQLTIARVTLTQAPQGLNMDALEWSGYFGFSLVGVFHHRTEDYFYKDICFHCPGSVANREWLRRFDTSRGDTQIVNLHSLKQLPPDFGVMIYGSGPIPKKQYRADATS